MINILRLFKIIPISPRKKIKSDAESEKWKTKHIKLKKLKKYDHKKEVKTSDIESTFDVLTRVYVD